MRQMSCRMMILAVLAVFAVGAAKADESAVVKLKNGSELKGKIVAQQPNKTITVEADEAVFYIDKAKVNTFSVHKVKYEDLSREWKRWALRKKALKGDAYGRYVEFYDIDVKGGYKHKGVARVENAETKRVSYCQIEQSVYTLPIADVAEIVRKAPKAEDVAGLDDMVLLKDGTVRKGTIVSQKPQKELTVRTTDGTLYTVKMSNVLELRKVARNKSLSVAEQAEYSNTVERTKGAAVSGIVTVQRYGDTAKKRYIKVLTDDGKEKEIALAEVKAINTHYADNSAAVREDAYKNGYVYVNEFHVKKAKTVTEGNVVSYVEKSVFPFPEGISVTFKSPGGKLQGDWRLVVLENTAAGGVGSWGYDKTAINDATVPVTSTDMSEGVSVISYKYLSPGFYALVYMPDPTDTYVIKITKN